MYKLAIVDKIIEVKSAFGNIGYSWDSNNKFELYAYIHCTTYANGVHHITGSGRITDIVKNVPSSNEYGLNIVKFRELLGLKNVSPIDYGHINYYRPVNGYDSLKTNLNGFGGAFFYYETGMMRLARYYDKGIQIPGTWAISLWELDDRFDFDFYAK